MGGEGEVGGVGVWLERKQHKRKPKHPGKVFRISTIPGNQIILQILGKKQEKEGCWNALTRGFLKRQVGRGSVGMLSRGDS